MDTTKHFGGLDSLDEVLSNLDKLFEYDSFTFQGYIYEVTEITLDYVEYAYPYNGKVVFVHSSAEGLFDVTMSDEFNFNKKYRCILLPDYCKDEFINLLKTK